MLDFFAEERAYCLSNFFELETFLKVGFGCFTKMLFGGLFEIKVIYFFEETEPDFIDAAEDSEGHSLDRREDT